MGKLTVVWWIAPEMFPAAANTQAVRDVLSRYVMIGIVHGRTGVQTASPPSKPVDRLTIMDSMSRSLSPLAANAVPAARGKHACAGFNSNCARPWGPWVRAMRWFIFDGQHGP